MKHKEGDLVTIKNRAWYDTNKEANGDIDAGNETFVGHMAQYCGEDAIITSAEYGAYFLDVDEGEFYWTDEMFEE